MTNTKSTCASGMLCRLFSAIDQVTRKVIRPDGYKRALRLLLLIAGPLCLGLSASSAGATTWIVSDTADSASDANSVRYAISHAHSGDLVTFATSLDGQVIVLTNGPLSIGTNVTVQGPGATLLTISGGSSTSVFSITSGTVTISGLAIANGHAAANGSGGGITISGGTVALKACTFAGNVAQNGGAISNAGALTVTSSTFFDNSALALGGGIQNSGTLTVTNSTFSANSAEVSGGAIDNNSGTMVLNNTTISGNSAETTGAGIFNNVSSAPAPTVTAVNSIVAGNTTGSVLGSDDCDNCGTQSASNMIGGAPHLGALGWNGGPTQTMIPLQGSPVIGAGSHLTGESTADQRGFERSSSTNVKIDLGAVQTSYYLVTSLDDEPTNTCPTSCTVYDIFNAGYSSGRSIDAVFKEGLVSATSPGTFDNGGSVLPPISGHLNFVGPGADALTIAASGNSGSVQIITVNSGADVVFSGFTYNVGAGTFFGQSGAFGNSGTLRLTNVNLTGVPNSFSDGSAVGILNSGIVMLSNGSLAGFAPSINNSGVAIVNDSSISSGGNITNTGTVVINRDSISGNYNEAGGGGLLNSGTATVLSSVFSGNSGYDNGGAINNSSTLSVSNSTFSGNMATGYENGEGTEFGGGAIYNTGTLNITSSTISANISQFSGFAGGIANYGSALSITNSIVVNNTGGDCSGDGCPQNGSSGNVAGATAISLSALGNHGGATATMLPSPGSAAICAGSPALFASSLTTDQRGFPRLNTTYAGYSSGSPCLDAGAVQTNYTSASFAVQPSSSVAGDPITPAPSVQVFETNPNLTTPDKTIAVSDIPVTMGFQGTGALEGTTTQVSTAGAATFSDLIINKAGTGDTLSVSLPILAGLTLTARSNSFNVTTSAGNPATQFVIAAPNSVTAGIPFTITVTAQDANNQTATGYSGTVHFSSADPTAILPANAAITSGVGNFTVTLFTAGNSGTVTVTDTAKTAITGSITTNVAPGPANKFVVTAPATAVIGAPIALTVTAYDIGGNVTTSYAGILHFTSTDTAAILPADSSLTQGTGTFAVTLKTAGSQTITAADNENTSLAGTTGAIAVGQNFNLVVTTAADDAGTAANCTIQSQPNVGKDAACSLRDAILNSNNSPGALITFDATIFAASNAAGNTINLKATLPVSASMTIQGPGANIVTISGGGTVGVFNVTGTGPVTIAGLTIASGVATFGGGMNNGLAGTLTINDSLFTGNGASGGAGYDVPQDANGGAIYNGGTLVVNRSAFISNYASGDSDYEDSLSGTGGAIYNAGAVTVNNSTFYGNSASPAGDGGSAFAGLGGAINNTCGTLAINSSTIVGNSASSSGGGVYSGIYNQSCRQNPTITNSIIAGNGGDDCDGCGTQSPYNLISTTAINAPLTPVGNFGGPTPTALPLPGTSTICAGSAALVPAGITTDQRGYPRLNTTYTGYTAKNACLDLGAVQSNYQSVQFTNAGSGYTATANQTTGPTPTPIVSVTESGQDAVGIPVTLAFTGTGTAYGLGPVTTVSGVGASFTGLYVSAAGTDSLSSTIQIAPTYSIVTDPVATLTVTASSLSAPTLQIAFGSATVPLEGTTSLTFKVTNPNSTGALTSVAFSNTLPAGLVIATPNSLTNTCGGTATGTAGLSTIALTGSSVAASSSCTISVIVDGTTVGNYVDTSSAITSSAVRGAPASASIGVVPTAVTHLAVSAPTTATLNTPFPFTVTALDANNNPVTNYSTTLRFSSPSGDYSLTFSANTAITNGTGTYSATSGDTYTQAITATDTANNNITGTSGNIAVSPPPTANLVVTTVMDDAGDMTNCTPQASPDKGTDKACSLRDAIAYASYWQAGKITFDSTVFATAKTISVNTGLFLQSNTSITGRTSGSGAKLTNLVTVSGGGQNNMFSVFFTDGTVGNATIANLIITNGYTVSSSASEDYAGGIDNGGSLTVTGSTLSNNTGGAISNRGILSVVDSTLSGNFAQYGVINNTGGYVTVTNSTISGNTGGEIGSAIVNYSYTMTIQGTTITNNTGAEAIYNFIGAFTVSNSILAGDIDTGEECLDLSGYAKCPVNGMNGNIVGVAANIAPLGNYGGPTQTAIPLPGSLAICAINPSTATGTDQRGQPVTTTYGSTKCQDAGAVQTNYSLAFAQQPTATTVSQPITPAPAVQLNESGSAFLGGAVTIPLTLTGNGKLAGGSAVTTATTGLATYPALSLSATGTGDTLTANLTLNGTIAISSGPSQAFDVTAAGGQAQTISFTLASPVVYGVAPIALSATATSGLAVSFSIISGPGTISGDTLTVKGAGTIVVAANQPGNTSYSAAPQVTQTLVVNASALTITANNASRVYGTANPGFTGTITGAKDGDTFTESFTTTATITSNVGPYAIVPVATGTNLADYTQVINNGTLSITQAASTTAVTVSSASITPGESVTLTAQVASATSGTPTGTVSFYDGTALLSTANLSAGAATYATAALAAGTTHTFTATYSGDTNFTGSNASASATVTVAPLGFTLTPPAATTLTATPGSSVSTTFTLDPLYGSYAGPVTFSIAGLPAGATAVFSPATIAANAGKQTVTLAIQLPATTAMRAAPSQGDKLAPITWAFLILPLFASGRMRRSARRMSQNFKLLSLALILVSIAAVLSGCGGHSSGGSSSQSTKTYLLTVTATSGTIQQSTTITLNVQ